MPLLSNIIDTVFNIVSVVGILSSLALTMILISKNKQLKGLQSSMVMLQKTYDELDSQAKLILKTDLDLHNTQGELDKKIAGLYTLQNISHTLSTTMDENEIFEKISEENITELGFDKVFILMNNQNKSMLSGDLNIKLAIGYTDDEVSHIVQNNFSKNVFLPVVERLHITSSLDFKTSLDSLNDFLKKCKLNAFICAPITTKEGTNGILFLGSESKYSPLTLGDKEIVSILATQIGQALENAKLFEETWNSYQSLEKTVQQRTKELSKALEDIKIVTKRKSDFVSAVSHELRTPLTSIKGYASLLSAGKLGAIPDAVKERLEKINKHADDLSQLINNLLDMSRIESGRVEMKIENINLKEMLDSVADLLAPQLKDRQLNFAQEVSGDLSTIPADKNQLLRVFINLIGNALKFTPANGKITVHATKKDNTVQIDIQDTGTGIAESNLDKVFEEFYREDNAINESVKGTGLGLSLVKYIVEAHKGKIWVTSKLGQGATFSFTLPCNRS